MLVKRNPIQTDSGCRRIREQSIRRQDEVAKRIKYLHECRKDWKYHTGNSCYKPYVLEKTVASIERGKSEEIDLEGKKSRESDNVQTCRLTRAS